MKKNELIVAALIAVVGVVLLIALESKIVGILLVLLALVFGFTVYNRAKHPEKGDIGEIFARQMDRFHRVRKIKSDR